MSDYISRQAAIELIDAVFPVDSMKNDMQKHGFLLTPAKAWVVFKV